MKKKWIISTASPITYLFSVDSGDKSGRASGEGALTLFPDDVMKVLTDPPNS